MREQTAEIPVVTMWPGGPLRRWAPDLATSEQSSGTWIPYFSKNRSGYASSYVCESCRQNCTGVYLVEDRWLGGCCKPYIPVKQNSPQDID